MNGGQMAKTAADYISRSKKSGIHCTQQSQTMNPNYLFHPYITRTSLQATERSHSFPRVWRPSRTRSSSNLSSKSRETGRRLSTFDEVNKMTADRLSFYGIDSKLGGGTRPSLANHDATLNEESNDYYPAPYRPALYRDVYFVHDDHRPRYIQSQILPDEKKSKLDSHGPLAVSSLTMATHSSGYGGSTDSDIHQATHISPAQDHFPVKWNHSADGTTEPCSSQRVSVEVHGEPSQSNLITIPVKPILLDDEVGAGPKEVRHQETIQTNNLLNDQGFSDGVDCSSKNSIDAQLQANETGDGPFRSRDPELRREQDHVAVQGTHNGNVTKKQSGDTTGVGFIITPSVPMTIPVKHDRRKSSVMANHPQCPYEYIDLCDDENDRVGNAASTVSSKNSTISSSPARSMGRTSKQSTTLPTAAGYADFDNTSLESISVSMNISEDGASLGHRRGKRKSRIVTESRIMTEDGGCIINATASSIEQKEAENAHKPVKDKKDKRRGSKILKNMFKLKRKSRSESDTCLVDVNPLYSEP